MDRGFYGNPPGSKQVVSLQKTPIVLGRPGGGAIRLLVEKRKFTKEEFLQMVDVENFEIAKMV